MQFSGRYGRLDTLYRMRDPWQLDGSLEQRRFMVTNRIIKARYGRANRLLELGCGEGMQSLHLREICHELTGLDVSPRAIARARERLPGARFLAGPGEQLALLLPGERFDLVIACEVLYYAADPALLLSQLQSASDQLLVTVFAPLAGLLDGPGWEALEPITAGKLLWHCRVWRAPGVTLR
ncbi:class I SAM-dependent methyltransferase [Altererythrobacter sp. BO-6]|nr:class I SAM-dependent methyltransferase [Altererythrobacter sp. BO-6]